MSDRQPDVSRRHVANTGGREAQFNQELGDLVRMRRRQQGMTQEQLAEAVGLARGSIANLERGTQAPTAFRMAALAQALRCTPCDLMPEPKATVSLSQHGLSEAQRNAVDSVRRAGAKKQSRGARR